MEWQPIVNGVLMQAAPYVGAVLVSLIGIGLKRLNDWIRVKVESERLETALVQVTEAVGSTVMDLEVQVRRLMSDGDLSEEDRATLRGLAQARVRQQIPKALKMLATAGLGDLEAYINGKIEEAVATMPGRKAL